MISTECPPTRTLTTRLSRSLLSRDARTKIRLGRCISTPCPMRTRSSGFATPWPPSRPRYNPRRTQLPGPHRCRTACGRAAGPRVHGFPGDEIKKLSSGPGEILGSAVQVDLKILYDRERLQRRHGEWNTCRHGLNGKGLVEILGTQSGRPGDCFALVLHSESWVDLGYLAECRLSIGVFEGYWRFPEIQL